MELKRLYDHDAPTDRWVKRLVHVAVTGPDGEPLFSEDGKPVMKRVTRMTPPVRAIKILHAGQRQHFWPSLFQQGITQGWLTLGAGTVTIKGETAAGGTETVVYRIVRGPGVYCCYCDQPLDAGNDVARAHVRSFHGDEGESPDPNNPAGYRQDNFFVGEKVLAGRGGVNAVQILALAAFAFERLLAECWRLGIVPIAGGANLVFNISLGRVAEFYNRVKTNDPAASELVVAVLATAGIESDATLKDKDTFADVVSGTTNEVTNTGYAKKVLGDADLVAFAPDDVNDRVDLDIPDQTWTGVAAGDGWNDIVICYDPVGIQTASDMIPMTLHDFVVTPDGSDITAQIAAAGFFRAS